MRRAITDESGHASFCAAPASDFVVRAEKQDTPSGDVRNMTEGD